MEPFTFDSFLSRELPIYNSLRARSGNCGLFFFRYSVSRPRARNGARGAGPPLFFPSRRSGASRPYHAPRFHVADEIFRPEAHGPEAATPHFHVGQAGAYQPLKRAHGNPEIAGGFLFVF
jgi:hypothetical protein